MPGQQRLHAFEHGAARAHGEEREELVEAARVGRGGHGAGGEQRLDLGAEEQPVALPAPVQRADADAVAGEEDGALGEVDERDGELAAQLLEDALAVLLVEVDDDLGIGVGAEDVALGLQLCLALGIVEQLAVVDDGDGAILVEDRLLAVAETDDGEAAVGEPEAGAQEEAVVVRAAVPERLRHALQGRRVRLPLASEVDDSSNAAHRSSSSRRAEQGQFGLRCSPQWSGKGPVTQRRKCRQAGGTLCGQLITLGPVAREAGLK